MKILTLFLAFVLSLTQIALSQYEVDFDLTTDDYPEETSWILLQGSTPIYQGGDYTSENNEYPTITFDLEAGEYTFTIFDEYEDGICCGFGNGGFTLTDVTTGDLIGMGGDFGAEMSITFTQPFVAPIGGCMDPDAINYNPDAETDDGSCMYEEGGVVIDLELVASGFDSPVDITHAGDERIFIVEQDGYIQIIDDEYNDIGTFLDIDGQVGSGGERGLLGLAFDPMYAENGYFYVNYTNNSGDSRISRFMVSDEDPNVADPDSELIILEQDQPFSNHNAGDLAFGPDGYLYFPFGDGGDGEDPLDSGQSPDTWLGKMLRIDVSNSSELEPYAIPSDNPFLDDEEFLPEIWAYGLRNTWRISFDAETGDLWMGDVGQYQWEEIDMEPAGDAGGRNYGWRCYEGTHDFNTTDCASEETMTWPVTEYNHSGGRCSVTGGFVYRSEEFPVLDGLYIYCDYCSGQFYGIRDEDGEWVEYDLLPAQGFGWTSFGEANDLDLYVAKSNGEIYKIVDPCGDFTAEITLDEEAGELTASEGEFYAWFADGELVQGETEQTFTPQEGNVFEVAVMSESGCVAFSEELNYNSVDELELNSFVLYPNPVKDVLMLNAERELVGKTINLLDINGKIIMNKVLIDPQMQINLSGFASGTYFIQIGNQSTSFIKE